MKKTVVTLLIATGLSVTSVSAQSAGFQKITVEDPGQPHLQVGVWYPTDQEPPATPNTEYEMSMALDATLVNPNGALIVISHGFGGWYAGHADTAAALADAGFIVAAPSHTGNTWSDMSSSAAEWVLNRPRHVSRVIDHLLHKHEFASEIKNQMIGVYGFSAGGYTALGLIGAVPDFDVAVRHCQEQPTEYGCSEGLVDALLEADMQSLPDSAWGHDVRIGAAVISAPGFGFAYSSESLSNVTAKLQLWSAQLDHSVPTATNAARLAERLPARPETHWIENAGHFAFMTVACREAFRRDDPEEYQMVCGDVDGFDRYQFHDEMHEEMRRFYTEAFGLSAN